METLKKTKWTYVVLSLFLIAMGVCIFVWPAITANTICICIGGAALLFGIIKLVAYFVREVRGVALNYDFSVGAICIIGGIILLIHPSNVVDLLRIVIGIYLLFDAVLKLQIVLDSIRLHMGGWWVPLLFALSCMVLGAMLIYNMEIILMALIGVALIVDGLQNLCMVIFSAVAARSIEKAERDAAAAAAAIDVTQDSQPEAPAAPCPPPSAPAGEAASGPEAPPSPEIFSADDPVIPIDATPAQAAEVMADAAVSRASTEKENVK